MIVMTLTTVIVFMFFVCAFMYGATRKTPEEQLREDEEQMEYCKQWKENHKNKRVV